MEAAMTKASQYVVERAKLMIKNNAEFVCVTVDLSFTTREKIGDQEEDCLTDPSPEAINTWITKLFDVDLASKPLNQKALEAMQKKGLTPSKQPSDLQLKVIIANSAHAVHVAVQGPYAESFSNDCFTTKEDNLTTVRTSLRVYTFPSEEAFKDRDSYMSLVFHGLKKVYPDFFVDDDEEFPS